MRCGADAIIPRWFFWYHPSMSGYGRSWYVINYNFSCIPAVKYEVRTLFLLHVAPALLHESIPTRTTTCHQQHNDLVSQNDRDIAGFCGDGCFYLGLLCFDVVAAHTKCSGRWSHCGRPSSCTRRWRMFWSFRLML